MRERVAKLGGKFSLSSDHGKGTQVRLDIPLGRCARPEKRLH